MLNLLTARQRSQKTPSDDAHTGLELQVNNDALESAGYPNLPTNLDMEHVVSVAATAPDKSRWSEGDPSSASKVPGSNFGARTVNIGAPGVNIVSAQASSRSGKGLEGRCACPTVPMPSIYSR